jgi:hypothetical protein
MQAWTRSLLIEGEGAGGPGHRHTKSPSHPLTTDALYGKAELLRGYALALRKMTPRSMHPLVVESLQMAEEVLS